MSLSLPLPSSPLRELFEVQDLVDYRNLPTFREGLAGCRRYMASDANALSAHSIVMRADGEFWLIRVGRRGGWKRLWNFGRRV